MVTAIVLGALGAAGVVTATMLMVWVIEILTPEEESGRR